jgi:hypothetical protein
MIVQPGGPSIGFVTTGTTSSTARIIPPLDNGANPIWVHVAMLTNAGTGAGVGFLFGSSAVAAATLLNTIAISGWAEGTIINVAGNTHYRCITPTTGVSFAMTPLAGIVPGG